MPAFQSDLVEEFYNKCHGPNGRFCGGSSKGGGSKGRSTGAKKPPIKGTFVDHDNATAKKAPTRSGVKDNERKVAPKASGGGGTPKGKIQSEEHTSVVKNEGKKMQALTKTAKYKDGSTEVHVAVEHSRYYGKSTTVTVKSKGKTIAKVFNDDDPPPTKKTVTRMLKEAKEWEKYGEKSGIDAVAGNLINEGGWRDYG
jgi:hypothetical protein